MYDIVDEDEDPSEVQKAGDQEENLPEGSVSTLNLDAEAEEVQGAGSSTEPQPGSSKSGVKRKLRSGKVSSKRPKEECQPIDPPPRYDLYSKGGFNLLPHVLLRQVSTISA